MYFKINKFTHIPMWGKMGPCRRKACQIDGALLFGQPSHHFASDKLGFIPLNKVTGPGNRD